MKNLMFKSAFFAVMALFLSVSSFAASVDTRIDAQAANSELVAMEDIDIDMWLVSDAGCKFHIVGEVSWSGSFSGTVTASGGEGCPNGTYTFTIAAPGGNIELGGDHRIVSILNEDPGMVREMAERMGLLE